MIRFDLPLEDNINFRNLGIFFYTTILVIAFIVHLVIYSNAKSNPDWDFIGTKDLDGNVDYKQLVEDNNIKPKKAIVQIVLLTLVFLSVVIEVNPTRIMSTVAANRVESIKAQAKEDGYAVNSYDYNASEMGIIYTTSIAKTTDDLFRTYLYISYDEKNRLNSISYHYCYDKSLSEEENFKQAEIAFVEFRDELLALIDDGLIDENIATENITLSEDFKTECLKKPQEKYVNTATYNHEEGYDIFYSRSYSDTDDSTIVDIMTMFIYK
ncbi:MAG: hypothetical protein IJ675_08105 [Pseudobutyrivibrio sp.]|nr:hypothetical protein [Pseudobutyrivibrio sp.]